MIICPCWTQYRHIDREPTANENYYGGKKKKEKILTAAYRRQLNEPKVLRTLKDAYPTRRVSE